MLNNKTTPANNHLGFSLSKRIADAMSKVYAAP